MPDPSPAKPVLVFARAAVRQGGKLLLVKEGKAESGGLWNLPGGAVEHGETIQEAARHQVYEESGLKITLGSLVGIYTSHLPHLTTVRFVFHGFTRAGERSPGAEILAVEWMSQEEIAALADSQLAHGARLRQILADCWAGRSYPLKLLTDFEAGEQG